MKKKLQNKDISKIVKSKLVRLLIGNEYYTTNTNRWFFQNDGQLDKKIIVSIQCHNGSANPLNFGDDFAQATFYNVVTGYVDFYNTALQTSTPTNLSSIGYLSLVNPEGRFFWYQQPLSSLNYAYNLKYPKRLYSRIILDKCYVESPFNISFGVNGVPSSYYVPFTFYYLDDPNF